MRSLPNIWGVVGCSTADIPGGGTVPPPFSCCEVRNFDDLASFLEADPSTFKEAVVSNWDPEDGFVSVWNYLASAPPPAVDDDRIAQTTYPGSTVIYLRTFPS